jgi:hypothetical protein
MNVADKAVAKLVIMDPAGKPCRSSKGDNPDRRVRRRAAGNLARIINGGIQRRRLRGIDKIHHSLANIVPDKKVIVTGGKNIDNGIANGKYVNSR